MKLRSVPTLFEMYFGRDYVGYVESTYSGSEPWAAYFDSEEIGAFRTRRSAEAAVGKAWRKLTSGCR